MNKVPGRLWRKREARERSKKGGPSLVVGWIERFREVGGRRAKEAKRGEVWRGNGGEGGFGSRESNNGEEGRGGRPARLKWRAVSKARESEGGGGEQNWSVCERGLAVRVF